MNKENWDFFVTFQFLLLAKNYFNPPENQNSIPRTQIDAKNNYSKSHDRYHEMDWIKITVEKKPGLLLKMFGGGACVRK